MLKRVVVQQRRRQVSQGAGQGQFESAVHLRFHILLAREFSWHLTVLPHEDDTVTTALKSHGQIFCFLKRVLRKLEH